MKPQDWQPHETVLAAQAQRQWAGLRRALLARGAEIDLVPPVERLPDLVFTANAAVVLDGKALPPSEWRRTPGSRSAKATPAGSQLMRYASATRC
jgi:N-dimethylarginine dimethylaminohydrolase